MGLITCISYLASKTHTPLRTRTTAGKKSESHNTYKMNNTHNTYNTQHKVHWRRKVGRITCIICITRISRITFRTMIEGKRFDLIR